MSGTALTPLGPATWGGLPVFRHRHAERERLLHLQLEDPVLVLWDDGRTEVDVYRTAREHWNFRGRVHHFDLYAPGHFEAITTSDDPSEKLVVMFPAELTSALLRDHAAAALDNCRFQFLDRALARLVRALAKHARDGEPFGPLYTRSLSAAVLEHLVRAQPREAPGADVRFSPETHATLAQLIDTRLASPPDVHALAGLASLRTSEFLKAFRHAFGSTPHQYVLERRIECAKRLLRQDQPMISIALELGFASHAHFSASFRARTGCTPSEFRAVLRRPERSGDFEPCAASGD